MPRGLVALFFSLELARAEAVVVVAVGQVMALGSNESSLSSHQLQIKILNLITIKSTLS